MALREPAKPALSRREMEVAALVAEGLTNREIAQRLFISERTADGHLEHIREKLEFNTRAQVAAWYVVHSQAGTAASISAPRRSRRVSRVPLAAATVALGVLVLGAGWFGFRQHAPGAATGPVIVTVAGSARGANPIVGSYSGDHGPATAAHLSRPQGLAIGPSGFLYIADTENQAIRRVDPTGQIVTLAGGVPTDFVEGGLATRTGIGYVADVAVGPDGLVYFSNWGLVGQVDNHLNLHAVVATPDITPNGLAIAPDGTLYISDTYADKVWRRATDGTLSVYAGTGTHGFAGDLGAATGAQLRYPSGLAVDTRGDLYIADTGNDRIRRVDAVSQVITTVAGSADVYGYGGDGGPATRALLALPFGVAVAPNGDIYIADTDNNRVRRIDPRTQLITTVAGTGAVGSAGDGMAAVAADLYGPYAVAISSSGDLYILDMGNQAVRMVRGVDGR